MKLKNLSKEELECMPYDEIAYLVLEETGKKEKLLNLYKKICKLLELDFDIEQDKIADFFEILSVNKKFIMLDNGYWDLQINHKADVAIEDIHSDDLIVEEEIEEEDEEFDNEEEDIFYESDETDDTIDDDLSSLALISDEEDETN